MWHVTNYRSMANFIKIFRRYLCCYWHIVLSFDSGYGTMGVNYAGKSFMKLVTGVQFAEIHSDILLEL
jgi:hypothetical protein